MRNQLLSQARTQARAASGTASLRASIVAAVAAGAPKGGGKVVLSVRTQNRIEQHFALTVEQSEQLRPMLRRAEAAAGKAEGDAGKP